MSYKIHYLQDNLPAQMLHVLFFCFPWQSPIGNNFVEGFGRQSCALSVMQTFTTAENS